MAKKTGAVRKTKLEDLPVRDVEAGEARVVTGGADGRANISEIQIQKISDRAS